jgi:hypothetical protein
VLAISIEENNEFYFGLAKPMTQAGLDRLALPTILRMDNDLRAAFTRPFSGRVGRTIIDDEHVIELRPRTFDYFADVCLLVIGGDNCSDAATIELPLGLGRFALHQRRTIG